MGGVATREEIICKLEELDKRELDLNLKLKDLQIQLNEMVPDEEKIKVNDQLGPDSKINNNYGGGGNFDLDDEIEKGNKKKKKWEKEEKKEMNIILFNNNYKSNIFLIY